MFHCDLVFVVSIDVGLECMVFALSSACKVPVAAMQISRAQESGSLANQTAAENPMSVWLYVGLGHPYFKLFFMSNSATF